MPAQPQLFSANESVTRGTDVSLEDLLRSLVQRLNANGTTSTHPKVQSDGEEIVVDTELDGWRYILIRTVPPSSSLVQLSPREQEIVRMVAEGHPNKVIAAVLNISSWTVGTHLRRIFAKLGVGSRAAMVARCLDIGKTVAPHATSANGRRAPFALANTRET